VFVTLAATQGLAAAQFSLAAMYMNGEIVERNNGKGIKWLKLSAEQVSDAGVWCSWLSLGWG